jgi:hypothetical protein
MKLRPLPFPTSPAAWPHPQQWPSAPSWAERFVKPIDPPPGSIERVWSTSWREQNRQRPWPYTYPYSPPADRQSAQPFLVGAANNIFKIPPNRDVNSSVLLSGSILGSPDNLSWRSDLGLWKIEQNRMNFAPWVTPSRLTDAVQYVESHYPASPPNDYSAQLADRVVTGGGGVGPGRFGDVPGLGTVGLKMDLTGMAIQYCRGGLSGRVILSNVIGMRNLLLKQHAPKSTIDLFNRQIGETAMWYKHFVQGTAEDT